MEKIINFKNKVVLTGIIIVLAIAAFFIIRQLAAGPEKPVVGENGQIEGTYSLESVMSLGTPYICKFEKAEGDSMLAGTLRTDSKNVFGEFRVLTPLTTQEFNSFLIIKENRAYVWTSLYSLGYETKVAKSASSKNASPAEQAQIVGLKDKLPLKCEKWPNPDQTTFDLPSWINFQKV